MVAATVGESSAAGASTEGGVEVEVAVVANKALASIPAGTGRLTLLTVGTHCGTSLRTLVVVGAVTGTVTTEIASHFGVLACAEHVVVDSSSALNEGFLCGTVPPAEDYNE